jgi:hypothetical protein
LHLVGQLIRQRAVPSSAAQAPAHATAIVLSLSRLIFLTDELTKDKYLVDTGATLGIIPFQSNSKPSGPLLKGANGLPFLSWGFVSIAVQFQEKPFTSCFFKPQLRAQSWEFIFCENSKSLLLQKPARCFCLCCGDTHRRFSFFA